MRVVRSWRSDPQVLFGGIAFAIASAGILLSLVEAFPLAPIDLIFFSTLLFLLSLYRPNWGFLFFLAIISFETVNVFPESFGFSLRPYQWQFLILVSALSIRIISRKSSWPLFRFQPLDGWLALIPVGAWVSGVLSGGEGIRLAAIVTSFYTLYLLSRVFFTTSRDIQIGGAVFFAGGLATLLFGLIQNIAFEKGILLQMIMPGRPNAMLAEPDWFGFFAVILLVFTYTALQRALQSEERQASLQLPPIIGFALLLIPISTALLLTVSRSAWLAGFMALIVWTISLVIIQGREALRSILQTAELGAIAFAIALFLAVDLPLTRFDLLNRAESTATGFQEITVACSEPVDLPVRIQTLAELSTYDCRHIALEERAALRAAGLSIQLVQRPDPNIVIRSEIYRQTWAQIRTHPFTGIGWGNIGDILGRDERGAAYNTSNVWFETLLGSGLLGLLGLAGALCSILWQGVRMILRPAAHEQSMALSLPAVFSIVTAFVIFNLFNAGLLIGLVWVLFATVPVLLPQTKRKNV